MTPPYLQDLAADLARAVLWWAPTHEPTYDLLRRALAQADPHGRAYQVTRAEPEGLVVRRHSGGQEATWLARTAGDGFGLELMSVRDESLILVPFTDLWSHP